MKEGNVYLITYLTHFIYTYMTSTHSLGLLRSREETALTTSWLLFSISSKIILYALSQNRIVRTTAFVTPVVEHWLKRERGPLVWMDEFMNKLYRQYNIFYLFF